MDDLDYQEHKFPSSSGENFYFSQTQSQRKKIPVPRIIGELDEILQFEQYDKAEKLILHWIEEAEKISDLQGELSLQSELTGLYRKTKNKELAMKVVARCFQILEMDGFDNQIFTADILINGATTLISFGLGKEGLNRYKKAEAIYHMHYKDGDFHFAPLYNNYGLALMAVGEKEKGKATFEKAVDCLMKYPDKSLDLAISYLNLADAYDPELDEELEKIEELVELAAECFENPLLKRDGYYAFVCKKCAPIFDYHGYFYVKNLLLERVKTFYEGT